MKKQLTVCKRDGRVVPFDKSKIVNAILGAFRSVDGNISEYAELKANNIADYVEEYAKSCDYELSIEEIQDLVEKGLASTKRKDVAKAYIIYREQRTQARENSIDKVVSEIVEGTNAKWNDENSNKDAKLLTTQRDYIAGEVSTDISRKKLLPKDVVAAHDAGLLHFHDIDYFIQPSNNCGLVNLEDMFQNGTIISGTYIDKPHKFSTACNIATQIIAQVASSQYGGQSVTLSHLSPFVSVTRETLCKKHPSFTNEMIEELVKEDIQAGIQTIQYQIITLMTTNGQAPFVTIYLNLAEVPEGKEREDLALVIEEALKQRYNGVKNEKGVYITPAFPKLIYALDDFNIEKGSKYYYLTELAAKCSAKRLVPDYMSNIVQRQLKNGDIYPVMGCRSALTPDRTTENWGKALNFEQHKGHKYYGRFNQGVVTINLPDVAFSAKDEQDFWKILDERLELCHKAMQVRHKRLLGTKSDIAPILWQNGAYARLEKGEKIDEMLFHGYSTLSLGYAGLYEAVMKMKGVSHTEEGGKQFGLAIMKRLNDACAKWKAEENIDYSIYGTP